MAFPPFEGSEVERFEEGNAKSLGALEAFVVLDRDLVGIFCDGELSERSGRKEREGRDETKLTSLDLQLRNLAFKRWR